MNTDFEQCRKDLKKHLSQGYNKDFSFNDFCSWSDKAESKCRAFAKMVSEKILECIEHKPESSLKGAPKNTKKEDETRNIEQILNEYQTLNLKKFMEEIYPLKYFLKSNEDLVFDSICLLDENKNTNHNAVLKKENKETFLEITTTMDGKFVLYASLYGCIFGSAPLLGVTTNDLCEAIQSGKPISSNPTSSDPTPMDDFIKEELGEIKKTIQEKSKKEDPKEALLVVSAFDKMPVFSDKSEHKPDFDQWKRLLVDPEDKKKFNGIYLVGLYDAALYSMEYSQKCYEALSPRR